MKEDRQDVEERWQDGPLGLIAVIWIIGLIFMLTTLVCSEGCV